ncbi:MAG TPA: DUF4136 domain-containing protein [Cytophagales bacterium]|nr:DUF4136 domain-containing protein [Cytophagales bacterium]
MSGIFNRTFILIVLLILSSCSPVKIINKDSAEGFELSDYKTFSFYTIKINGDTLHKPYHEKIKALAEEISRQLEKRSLQKSENNADLMVNIGIVVKEKIQTRTTTYPLDAPIYIGQRRYSWESEEVETGRYKEGTVSIHLVDNDKNKLVWKGVASSVIPKKTKQLRKNAANGMEELFKDIPL